MNKFYKVCAEQEVETKAIRKDFWIDDLMTSWMEYPGGIFGDEGNPLTIEIFDINGTTVFIGRWFKELPGTVIRVIGVDEKAIHKTMIYLVGKFKVELQEITAEEIEELEKFQD